MEMAHKWVIFAFEENKWDIFKEEKSFAHNGITSVNKIKHEMSLATFFCNN